MPSVQLVQLFHSNLYSLSFTKYILKNNFINQAKQLNFSENDIKFVNVSKKELTSNIKDKIFTLPEVGLMQPFKTNFGFHVVQISGVIDMTQRIHITPPSVKLCQKIKIIYN